MAITEDRPYQSALTHEEAIEERKRQAGKQFDPGVVEVFCKVIEREEEHLQARNGDGYAGT